MPVPLYTVEGRQMGGNGVVPFAADKKGAGLVTLWEGIRTDWKVLYGKGLEWSGARCFKGGVR